MNLSFVKNNHTWLLAIFFCSCKLLYAQDHDRNEMKRFYKKAKQLRYTNSSQALKHYNQCIAYYEAHKDSVKVIDIKNAQMSIYSGLAKYQMAYDIAWSLLPYVQRDKYAYEHVVLLHKMTNLYMIYQQYDKAHKTNHEAGQIIENKITDKKDKNYLLTRLYTRKAWILSEASKDYLQSEQLLLKTIELLKTDRSENSNSDNTKLQLAELYLHMYRFDDANTLLCETKDRNQEETKSINILIYEHLGKYHQMINQPQKSIEYYILALSTIDSLQAHISNKVEILESISGIYAKIGNSKKAYDFLLLSKSLNDSVFSSTSVQNKKLFEIKNQYDFELKKQKEQLQKQKITTFEKEEQLWILKSVGSTVIILLISIGIILTYKRKNKHHLLEKNLMKQKQDEILEIKNRELLSSALQLIERDSQQDSIRKTLEKLDIKKENKESINRLIKSLNVDKSKKWKEFETYFTAVNNDFYISLKNRFPKLTATDLKICAFIKLSFSSKDMSQIMGIGVEGINTTRCRLRKKLNLTREVVLAEFLQTLDS